MIGAHKFTRAQASTNQFPEFDHLGSRLTGQRAKLTGLLNQQGVVPIFVGMSGDWKFMAETFKLPHTWSTAEPCSMCLATKAAGPLSMANALIDAPWVHTRRTMHEYLLSQENVHPFVRIPGWHIEGMFEDALHDDLLGVRPLAVGGAMKDLADAGCWGNETAGEWKVLLNLKLDRAWNAFNHWLIQQNVTINQPPFSANILGMHRLTDWPELKGKGAACASVSRWLAEVALDFLHGFGGHHDFDGFGFVVFWGYAEFVQ